MEYLFSEDDKVTIHSLGENTPGEFRGIVRGRSTTYQGAATFYIIQLIDRFDSHYNFSCCTMPAACLRKGWEA